MWKGDLVTDPDSILAKRRNNFSWLSNAHIINDVRWTEIPVHTTEPLVSVPYALEFDWLLKSQWHIVLKKAKEEKKLGMLKRRKSKQKQCGS